MAGKFPNNSMHNRAKMIVMKKHFPEHSKGLVSYIADHKRTDPEMDFAELVGRKSVFGQTLSEYLKQEGLLDTVNNIVHELVMAENNINAARAKYDKFDYQMKTNKGYAHRKLFETFVESATPPEVLAALREDGTPAKRAMVALGEFLGVGNDVTKSAVFATILDGTRKEAFKRRNKAIDSQRIMAGQDLMIANDLANDTYEVAKEKNIPVADKMLSKFRSIAKKAKTTLAACAIMSVSALSATSPAPESPEIDGLLQKANIEQVVQQSYENPFSTLSRSEMERLATHYNPHLEHSGTAPDSIDHDALSSAMDDSMLSPIQVEMENERFEQRNQGLNNSIAGGNFVVEAGDTLSGIADNVLTEMYGDYLVALTNAEYQGEISKVVQDLAQLNGIDNPDLIFPEQVIEIPAKYKASMENSLEQRIDNLANDLEEKPSAKSSMTFR